MNSSNVIKLKKISKYKYLSSVIVFTLIVVLTLNSHKLLAQSEGVAIGIDAIDPSAVLHLDILNLSTPKGFLPTRMNSTVRGNIVTPANGLIIFNTETNSLQINTGTTTSPVWVSLISSTITGDLTYSSSASSAGTFTLVNSGVASGTYGSATQIPILTVDSKGRITSATFAPVASNFGLSNGRILVGDGSNLATEVTMSGDATISNTGALTLANTGVSSASYGSSTRIPMFSVDSKGRITSATFADISSGFGLNDGRILIGNGSNVATQVTMSGDATISNSGALSLANSGVFNGTYGATNQFPIITIDSKGRITSATFSDVTSAFGLANGRILIGDGTNIAAQVTMSGDATISNTGALTLANTGVASGTFGSTTQIPVITLDSKGRVTSATFTSITAPSQTLSNGNILVGNASNLATDVTMSGDATISNTGALTLANTGVSSGTFGNSTQVPVITLDSKGRVTSATFASITAPSQTLTNGNIFVGNASNLATDVTMSGDATISNAGALTLVNTGVSSGTFGSSTAIPVIAVDSKGRLTYSGTVSFSSSGTTSLQAAYDGPSGTGSGRSFTVGNGAVRMLGTNTADVTLNITNSANGGALLIDNTGTGNSLRVTNGSSTYLTLNSAGSLALGASTPNELLTLDGVLSLKESAAPSLTTGYGKVYSTTDNNLFYKDESGTISMLSKEYAVFRDLKTPGTEGGTALADSWNERTLNEDFAQFGTSITRSGSTITLTAGTYKVRVSAPAYKVNGHKVRLRNKTDNAVIVLGTSEYSSASVDVTTTSTIDAIFTLNGTKELLVEHYVKTDSFTSGYGKAANVGSSEVYTVVEIERVR